MTDGLLVFVQLVMAAITTAPWPISDDCAVVRPPVAVRAMALRRVRSRARRSAPRSALRKDSFMSRSGTRSCGRLGPARLGSTVPRSSARVLRETWASGARRCGTGAAPWCSARPAATSASVAAGAAQVARAFASSTGKKPIVAPYSGAMLAIVARSASFIVRHARPVELDELARRRLPCAAFA